LQTSETSSQSKSSSDAQSFATSASISHASGGNSSAQGGNSTLTASLEGATLSNSGNASATGVNALTVAATASGEGGSSDNEVTIYGDEAPTIPVATAVAGATNTTATCWVGRGVGVQAQILGFSLGGAKRDEDCVLHTLAQSLYATGRVVAGDRLMCRIRALREALGAECLALMQTIRVSGPDPRLLKKQAFEAGLGK
jgi:hypothetical protein